MPANLARSLAVARRGNHRWTLAGGQVHLRATNATESGQRRHGKRCGSKKDDFVRRK
jgi:hypothetical protein